MPRARWHGATFRATAEAGRGFLLGLTGSVGGPETESLPAEAWRDPRRDRGGGRRTFAHHAGARSAARAGPAVPRRRSRVGPQRRADRGRSLALARARLP